jgi:hypothetical protein
MSIESITVPSDLSIFLFSSKDSVLKHVFERFQETARDDMKTFIYLDVDENTEENVDPIVSIAGGGSAALRNVRLFDWLAVNFAHLKIMRVITLLSDFDDQDVLRTLIRGTSALRSSQKKLALHLEVQEFRVFAAEIGSEPPRQGFFEQGIHGNLVIIPLDSSVHGVVSRPVVKSNLPLMVDHISTEIATIFCLWKEMEEGILGSLKVRSTGNADDVFVRFVSSRVSILKCPPLPVADLISASGDLPAVNRFFAAPEPEIGLKRLIPKVYPKKLIFENEAMPDGIEETIRSRNYLFRYLKEVCGASFHMPRFLIQGLQSEIDEMAGIALQEAVGGNESTIKVLFPSSIENSTATQINQEYIDTVIAKISEKSETPVLDAIGANTWKEIVESVLSVVDGSEAGTEFRKVLGDERFLLTSRDVLGPSVDQLEPLLLEIYGTEIFGEIKSVENVALDLNESGELETVNQNELDGDSDAPQTNGANFSNPNEEDVSSRRKNLLSSITQEITLNAKNAHDRAAEILVNLHELPNKFGAKNVEGISSAVNMAVLLGISILYLTIGTVTPARYWLSFEKMTDIGRELLWTVSSTLVLLFGLAGLVIKTGKKWQGRFIAFISISVLILGAEVVFFDRIRDFISNLDFIRFSEIVGVIILATVVAVVFVSAARNRLSDSVFRRKYANAVMLLLWVYSLVGVTAYLGQDQSILQTNLLESRRLGMATLGLVFSIALILASAVVVGVVIVRERKKLNRASLELNWCIDELHKSADAQRRLNAARIQWLGTAAVLARVLRLPLGAEASLHVELTPNSSSFNKALKCDVNSLNLTVKGEQALSARVRQLFIRDGWLTRQYSIMIEQYRNEISVLLGLDNDETKNENPESCPAVPLIQDVLNGNAKGGRWSFLRSVFAGRYDEALIAVTGEVSLSSAYSNVVRDPDTHTVGETGLTISEYLGRLVPKVRQSLPGEVVSTLFIANDDRQKLNCYVWWPSEFVSPANDKIEFKLMQSKVYAPSKLNSWVNVLSSCVLVSEFFALSEVGVLDFKSDVEAEGYESMQEDLNQNNPELL